jgi:hypothetical protein
MKSTYLPDVPPWLPDMTGPGVYPEETGPLKPIDTYEDARVRIRKNAYWKRVLTTSAECKQKLELKFTLTTGFAHEIATEISTELGGSIGTPSQASGLIASISSKFGSKQSEKDTITKQTQVERKKEIPPKKCCDLYHLVWQQVELFHITEKRSFIRLRWRKRQYSAENLLDVDKGKSYYFERPNCCKEGFTKKLRDGFDKLIQITFPDATFEVLGRAESGEAVSIPGIEGRLPLGQTVTAEQLGSEYIALFEQAGYGIREEGRISVLRRYGAKAQTTHVGVPVVKMLAVGAAVALAGAVYQSFRNRARHEIKDNIAESESKERNEQLLEEKTSGERRLELS